MNESISIGTNEAICVPTLNISRCENCIIPKCALFVRMHACVHGHKSHRNFYLNMHFWTHALIIFHTLDWVFIASVFIRSPMHFTSSGWSFRMCRFHIRRVNVHARIQREYLVSGLRCSMAQNYQLNNNKCHRKKPSSHPKMMNGNKWEGEKIYSFSRENMYVK